MGDIIIGHHGFDNLDTISNATRALWLESAIFAALNERALGLSMSAYPCSCPDNRYVLWDILGPGVFNYGKYMRLGGSSYFDVRFTAGWTPSRWRVFQFHFRVNAPQNSKTLWYGWCLGYDQWRVKYDAFTQRLQLWSYDPDPPDTSYMIAQGTTLVGDAGWHYGRMLVNTARAGDSPSGYFHLEVDGNIQWTVSGADLADPKLSGISHLGFRGEYGGSLDLDNLLIIGSDDTSAPSGVYPEYREQALLPVEDDVVMDWTSVGVANAWDAVNDPYPDEDSTHIRSGTVGHRALFRVQSLSAPYGILCWTQDARVRKDNAEDRGLYLISKIDGAITSGRDRDQLLSQSYLSRTRFMNQKPGGGAMSESDFNASRWGVEVAS